MDIFSLLFVIGIGMIGLDFFSNSGSFKKNSLRSNVAIAVILLLTYVLVIMTYANTSSQSDLWGILSGGVPGISNFTDYQDVIHQNTIINVIITFFDCTIIVMIVELISVFSPKDAKLGMKLIIGIVLSAISFILLYYIKQYLWLHIIMILLCIIISLLAISSFVVAVISKIKEKTQGILEMHRTQVALGTAGSSETPDTSGTSGNRTSSGTPENTGISGNSTLLRTRVMSKVYDLLIEFSKTKLASYFRSTFFKGILYTVGLYLLENQLKEKLLETTNVFLSVLGSVLFALGPIVIMLIGIYFVIRAGLGK